jgi:NADH-quinone oxidoreductase subunit G/NADP-reducing hydrogenase subunit HndD
MSNVNLTINGKQVAVPAGTTILDAAKTIGLKIPTLCFMKDINEVGVCRVCVVEVEGAKALLPSCVTKVTDNMVVKTNSPAALEARRMVMNLILANHPKDCFTCERNGNCELRTMADDMGIRDVVIEGHIKDIPLDNSNPAVVRDSTKCILCRRCVSVCGQVQKVSAIGPVNRGIKTNVEPAFGKDLGEVACVLCGQCTVVCPTGALTAKNDIHKVWKELNDPNKHVVIQLAPAIRVSLGEEFGNEPGTIVTGKTVAALKSVGFNMVFDTDFTADLTIIEEGNEFLKRFKEGGKLPMITSCSPGWIKFIEHFYPEFLDNLSTCKSPQQMFGAIIKTYYAEKHGIDPSKIFVVSGMPCTAKKFEATRPEMFSSGYQDVDVVLTTRELGQLIKEAGVDWDSIEEAQFDEPFGEGTGAGLIFGSSGGVMEAALRTVYEVVLGKELPNLDFVAVRGLEGIKEAEVDLEGTKVRVAVANSLGNAKILMDKIVRGEADYHFIEIMACPGGCIGGGGQPQPSTMGIKKKRMEAIYNADKGLPGRKSHENPAVKLIYEEFLKEPLGHKSHDLLHTHYTERGK